MRSSRRSGTPPPATKPQRANLKAIDDVLTEARTAREGRSRGHRTSPQPYWYGPRITHNLSATTGNDRREFRELRRPRRPPRPRPQLLANEENGLRRNSRRRTCSCRSWYFAGRRRARRGEGEGSRGVVTAFYLPTSGPQWGRHRNNFAPTPYMPLDVQHIHPFGVKRGGGRAAVCSRILAHAGHHGVIGPRPQGITCST
jgi:hypothetical protein